MRFVIALAIVASVTTGTSAASPVVRWFHSPSRNISCEVGANRPTVGTYAYCATVKPPRCVKLKATGQMSIKRGSICLGNEPQNAFTLRYGRSVRVGPFRCSSRRDGIRCVIVRTGRGFLINRAGVKRI